MCRWIREGRLRAINTNVGGAETHPRWRIDKDDLLTFLRREYTDEALRKLFP